MAAFPPLSPTSVTKTIPAYVYVQYNDDDDLQAFNTAFNTLAQGYVSWFANINLPIYTAPTITGPLLDWVAQGIYGMARPTLASAGVTTITGPLNTYEYDTTEYAQYLTTVTGSTYYIVTDDLFKRIITWNFYKGDGTTFNIRWLKRRICRFLNGVNGVDVNCGDTSNISAVWATDGVTGRYTVLNISIANGGNAATILQTAIQSSAVQLPFQYTYNVTTTGLNEWDVAKFDRDIWG